MAGIKAVIHPTRTRERLRRFDEIVHFRDCDVPETRCVVGPVWPARCGHRSQELFP